MMDLFVSVLLVAAVGGNKQTCASFFPDMGRTPQTLPPLSNATEASVPPIEVCCIPFPDANATCNFWAGYFFQKVFPERSIKVVQFICPDENNPLKCKFSSIL